MNAERSLFSRLARGAVRAFLAAVLGLVAGDAQAALTHRYSFNTDITDSVGNANGTIQGNVTISGGAANFPGQSNTDYLELPSGLITNYTSLTFELWVNVADNGTWEELYAFGNQDSGGAGANMLMFCPHTGSTPPDFRMSYAQTDPGYNDEHVVNGTGILDNLGPMSVACVYDPPNNAMSLYTNGVLVGTLSPVTTGAKGFSLTNIYDVHCWLGRSLYNADAPYNGTIDEFRIYDKPLGPLQVFVDNAAGPDTVVTNIAVNSLAWHVSTNMVIGSRQDSTITFNTAKYGSVTLPGATEASYSSADPTIVAVNANGQLFAMSMGSTTVFAGFNGSTNSAVVSVTEPQLIHRYSFTTDASDSVGGANGQLVGAATISGGAVNLPGGVASSDPSASYVNLPNNMLTNVTAITMEAWATDNGGGNWARVWDFGNSVGGEDVSDTGSRYMYLSLPSGNSDVLGNIHVNDRGGDITMEWTTGARRPAVGTQAQIVWATDIAHRLGWLYVNGALVAKNNNMFVAPADIGPTVNDWLGRSQYADPTFDGSISEFRIYNGALPSLQIALDAATGPDNIVTNPGPVLSVQLTIGTNVVSSGGLPVAASLLANFANATNVNVTSVDGAAFQSSDPTVATIDANGLIDAAGTGSVTLTGSFGGKTATLPLTVTTLPGYIKATLVHRYSFSDAPGSKVAKDSVGSADGAIAGTGAAFDGKGQLSLPGGTASNADPSVISGYVDLPNHIIDVLSNLSIEAWVTWQGSGSWQRIFDFGTSASGEDVSDGNGAYLFMSPEGDVDLRFSVRDPATGTEPAPLTAPAPLVVNQEIYVAVTYDYADNVARLYSNSVLVASGAAPVDITTIDDVNNWLGRSQWGDPMFQGKYNEFRIWNGVLLPSEIASDYAAGPDSLEALPKLTASISNQNLILSWPASATGFALQSTAKLGSGTSWAPVTATPSTANGVTSVNLPVGPGTQFFRLGK